MEIIQEMKLFWIMIWLSITSRKFYRDIDEHIISGKYYLFLCSTFSTVFLTLMIPISTILSLDDFNNFPTLEYSGKVILNHEKVYVMNENNKPFILIDVENDIEQIKVDKKVRFIFSKDKLLVIKNEAADYTNLKNYNQLSYINLFGNSSKAIDSNELKKIMGWSIIYGISTNKLLFLIIFIVALPIINLMIFTGSWLWAKLNLIMGDLVIWDEHINELQYMTRMKLAICIIAPSIIFSLGMAIINPLLGFITFCILHFMTASIAVCHFKFNSKSKEV